jgi:hypothetical protein
VEHVSCLEEMKCTCNFLVEKPEGKRLFGWPRYRWVNNIKMDLKKLRWEELDWIHFTQDSNQWQAVVNMAIEPWGFIKGWGFLDRLSNC